MFVRSHNRSFRGSQKGLALVRTTCPHLLINYNSETGNVEVIPTFFSPAGRFDYLCQRCGLSEIYDERVAQSLMYKPTGNTMSEIAKKYRKREKAFARAVKKYNDD